MSPLTENCNDLKKLIREVPDFPKPGILFYDITTLLKDRKGFALLIDSLTEYYIDKDIDLVLGIEARGFIFGPALAYRLNAGFVPVRKPKKLPAETLKWTYDLEYGNDTLEIHKDAITPGTARAHLRRPAGHRRYGARGDRNGEVTWRRHLRIELRGGTRRTEGPGQAEGVRRVLAAALRDVEGEDPGNLPDCLYEWTGLYSLVGRDQRNAFGPGGGSDDAVHRIAWKVRRKVGR